MPAMNIFSSNLPNLRHLTFLTLLAAGHSVHMVARMMHVSQPAVTLALTRLELQFEASLFDRTQRKGLVISPQGVALDHRTRRFLAQLEAGAIAALRLGASGELGEEARAQGRYVVSRLSMRKIQAMASLPGNAGSRLSALRLGITAPSLRRLIAECEGVLGVPLLATDRQSIRLTESGTAFANACSLALHEITAAYDDLAELVGGSGGGVTIGSTMVPATELLPGVLLELGQLRPKSTSEVVVAGVRSMIDALRRGELDVICSTDRTEWLEDESDLVSLELFPSHVRVFAREGHPLAGKPAPNAEEMRAYPWITPGAGTLPARRLREFFEAEGLEPPRAQVETLVLDLACRMLRAGDHLLVWAGPLRSQPLSAGLVQLNRVIYRQSRPVWLIYRRDMEPTAAQRVFLELVRAAGRRLSIHTGEDDTSPPV